MAAGTGDLQGTGEGRRERLFTAQWSSDLTSLGFKGALALWTRKRGRIQGEWAEIARALLNLPTPRFDAVGAKVLEPWSLYRYHLLRALGSR